ncbi:extracellular solute-binding protein [Natronosporangium hydrolyticum]|uniref:Extracellular solute-binding protein n=1 Tax=Natronosporangium hydrolyticum TaxID=2811111 RepID=A0A895YII5_9ACTN|nr:extracellular solute-binding protein [Natronosporangium hydrolyticum]QSB15339.1 extracellular solute-binding protein [Natronosporangium hydrolyticum]
MSIRRTTLATRSALAAVLLATATACSVDADADPGAGPGNGDGWQPAGELTGSLVLYSANPQDATDDLIAVFEERTGVTVEKYGDQSGQLVARLDAEWDNPQADLVYLASWSPAARYAAEGRLVTLETDHLDEVHDGWAAPGGEFVGRDGSALTLVVNTDVAPHTPADWADLASGDWQGQVTMPDPRESGTARDLIAAMVIAWGEDETWALFDDLFDNGLHVAGANGPALDNVVSGSYAAVLGGVDYLAYAAVERGEPLAVVAPDSGTTVSPRPLFIPAGAGNPAAAQAFVDFMLSPEGQAISVDHKLLPARADTAVAPDMVGYDEVTQLEFSFDEVGERGGDLLAEFVARYLD